MLRFTWKTCFLRPLNGLTKFQFLSTRPNPQPFSVLAKFQAKRRISFTPSLLREDKKSDKYLEDFSQEEFRNFLDDLPVKQKDLIARYDRKMLLKSPKEDLVALFGATDGLNLFYFLHQEKSKTLEQEEERKRQEEEKFITHTKEYREKCQTKYSDLCNLDSIRIPKIISLPTLPVDPPKGFEDESTNDTFLLTEERYQICKEVEDFLDGRTSSYGIVPSGPHGMGKSAIGLLLACYAFVNKHFLIYIPKTRKWADRPKDQICTYFLECFKILNADLAVEFSIDHHQFGSKNLWDFVSNLKTDPYSVFTNLMSILSDQTKHGVFYIFDEHNELFRRLDGGPSLLQQHSDVLGSFTRWTGLTSGKKTVTVYIGSAHSCFELKLPGGEGWRIRYLQPLKESEVELLISEPNSPLYIPEKMYEKHRNHIVDKLELLKYYTGFLPRELRYLKEANDFQKFEESRVLEFRRRAMNLYETSTPSQREEYNKFLIKIMVPRIREHHLSVSGAFFDQGIVYNSPNGFEIVSGPARVALMPLLYRALKNSLRPIDTVINDGERGAVHEQWNIAQFSSGNVISIQPYFVGKKNLPTPGKFEFSVHEIVHFGNNEPILSNLENRRRLYVPIDQSFPGWDCIYDDGITTAFFSFSISHLWSGDPSHAEKILRTFQIQKDESESKNSQIMSHIRGKKGYQIEIKQNKLFQKDPEGKDMKSIHYFYGCGQKKKDIMETAGVSRRLFIYRILQFYGREEMEQFGVQFSAQI